MDKSQNYEKFKQLVEKYNFLPSDTKFFEELGDELNNAPFSNSEEYGGAEVGGLLRVLIEHYIPTLGKFKPAMEDGELNVISALKVVLFQHIAKMKYFVPTKEDWKRKKGIMYDFNPENKTRLKCGAYSYLLASKYGLVLNESEYEAFLSIDIKEADGVSMYSSELTSFIFFLNNIVQRRLRMNG